MTVDVYFTPAELGAAPLPSRVVVVDVLRATSTIIEALANGARSVVPVATPDEAVRIAQNIGRDSVLLCGERKALPIEGFDLGNAPAEFTRDRVADRALVMTTTNGTRAFLAVAERQGSGEDGPSAVLAASFLNLGAIIDRLAGSNEGVAVVCAGREGRFALEDALCAGSLVKGLEEAGAAVEPNDAAAVARSLAGGRASLGRRLAETVAGRTLAEIGQGEDVEHCAALDRWAVVPRLRERKITLE